MRWQPRLPSTSDLHELTPAHLLHPSADPLNLGVNKEALNWYRNAELQNGRWAMLGVAGIIVPAGARTLGREARLEGQLA